MNQKAKKKNRYHQKKIIQHDFVLRSLSLSLELICLVLTVFIVKHPKNKEQKKSMDENQWNMIIKELVSEVIYSVDIGM